MWNPAATCTAIYRHLLDWAPAACCLVSSLGSWVNERSLFLSKPAPVAAQALHAYQTTWASVSRRCLLSLARKQTAK